MNKNSLLPSTLCRGAGLATLFAALTLLSGPNALGQHQFAAATHVVLTAEQPLAQGAGGEHADQLHLLVGRSMVITSPARIHRISVADPNIADAMVMSPTQILVNGKTPGGVSLVVWDEADRSQTFDILVDLDIMALAAKIHEVFPHEPVLVEATKDVVVLSGNISSKAVADRINAIVSAATPKVISLMEWPAPPQAGEVLLEVKFAELDRVALSQLGFNLLSVPGSTTRTLVVTGTQQFGPIQVPTLQTGNATGTGSTSTNALGNLNQVNLTLSDLLNVFIFRPDINLGATIKALQQENVLQILAEPNLLTETGKDASFLAGGEFPFPVVQGGAAGTVPTVTIQFKEFGVRLNFSPVITEEGRIHLHVRPEVSALDFTNALTISGFLVPALSTRRADAEMELKDGQSFAIAGLVDDRVTKVMSKVPGFGDIPILGQLFRTRSIQKSKTELLVVVTPHIVKPLEAGQVPEGPQFPEKYLNPAPAQGKTPPQEKK
ncbi:MAG: type II and III secretion system protein family protein [Candidatus Acidiferrales bacterium]